MKPMMRINRALSHKIAEAVGAQDSDCFHNAIQTMMRAPKSTRVVYVEGYAVGTHVPIPLTHGWVEGRDKRGAFIIEVTPSWLGMHGAKYFPAVRYTLVDVWAKVKKKQLLPFFDQDGTVIPAIAREAYIAAQKECWGPEWPEIAKYWRLEANLQNAKGGKK